MTDILTKTHIDLTTLTPESTIPAKKSGCFFRGCMGCLGFGVITTLLLVIGGWRAWSKLGSVAIEWSAERPLEMRSITLSGTADLEDRRYDLKQAVENKQAGTYILDQDMLDLLLLEQGDEQMVDAVLGDGEATVSLSLPLAELELKDIENRFLNGTVRGTFDYTAGRVEAYILDIDVPGKKLPKELTDALYTQNIGPEFYRNEEFVEFIQTFDAIYFSGNQIVLEIPGI